MSDLQHPAAEHVRSRRRLQFSLRELLVVITLIALVVTTIAAFESDASWQRGSSFLMGLIGGAAIGLIYKHPLMGAVVGFFIGPIFTLMVFFVWELF